MHADLAAVEPDAGLPVDPLQEEFHALALPVGRDLDVALVPGRPGVDVRAIESVERGFRRVGQAEFRFVGRSGQLDFARQPRGIPLLLDAGFFGDRAGTATSPAREIVRTPGSAIARSEYRITGRSRTRKQTGRQETRI